MPDYKWWKDSTIYQIWPASYKDSNGDGKGDLQGIISTLDYLKDLGSDIVWLSPMFKSPQDDMGYDISDYQDIHAEYGTMKDMDQLITELHKREMKIVLDLVVNHTSSEHDWFKESRSSLDNPKRNWYIWKKPKYDADGNRQPPNNWGSHFSGSAWTYDETTDEYYLHLFAKSQPDLNWENEETRHAIYDSILKFWFDKGVDGFRIDVANLYSKVQTFEDAPIVFPEQPYQTSSPLTANGPRIHEFHKEMFEKVTSKYDVMTVGEVGYTNREEALKYVSAKEKQLNMVFLFSVVEVGTAYGDRFEYLDFSLTDFKAAVKEQAEVVGDSDAWSTVFIENHDQPRSVTRFGNPSPEYREKSAKLISLLQSTLTGTLFIYQGQEIAMTNLPRSWPIEEYKDINTIGYYEQFKKVFGNEPDYKERERVFLDNLALLARDHARSPVQWDDSPYAGFSTVEPWTRVNDNYKEINVASQLKDPHSVLNFWKNALIVRKEWKDLLIYGGFEILEFEDPKLFTYVKFDNKNADAPKAYVVLNFSGDSVPFKKLIEGKFTLANSNFEEHEQDVLSPYEGRLYIVEKKAL